MRGQRREYRAVESALCRSHEPLAVAQALCEAAGADCLYVADLDAILGRAPQLRLLKRLLAGLPGVQLWLDAGYANLAAARAVLAALGEAGAGASSLAQPGAVPRVRPVFGSESLASAAALHACFAEAPAEGEVPPVAPLDALLSLDRRAEAPMDPAGAWDSPRRWPRDLIVMTLDRVGARSGPDLHTLAQVRALAPHAHLIGAGGIRHATDLLAVQAAGANAWLVASALHDRMLDLR